MVVSSFLSLSVLIGSAILVGHTQSKANALEALGFGMCEGKPCFRNIIPGITKWDDIQATLIQQGGTHSVSDIGLEEIDIHLGRLMLIVSRRDASPVVNEVDVQSPSQWSNFSPLVSSLSDVSQLFDVPCSVSNFEDGYLEMLYPSGLSVVSDVHQNRVDLAASVYLITLQDLTYLNMQPQNFCRDREQSAVSWTGFASIGRYQTLGLWWNDN